MSTQKTSLGGNGPQPPDDNTEEDLGLSEDHTPMAEDPSGFVAASPVQNLSGRSVRPMTDSDLTRAHQMQAGNVPMFGNASVGPEGGKELPPIQRQPQAPAASSRTQQQAEEMLPDYMRSGAPKQEDNPQSKGSSHLGDPQGFTPSDKLALAQSYQFDEIRRAVEHLLNEEENARASGDYLAAHQARRLIDNLIEDYDFDKVEKPKAEHPAMSKLKANLGLEQIKPTTIPWAGSNWMFAATNARLDQWVNETTSNDGSNIAAVVISASLVGLDDVPMFEFLGIPLEEEYSMSDPKQHGMVGGGSRITVTRFWKYCQCGAKIRVNEEKCNHCGAVHSKFEMPTDLRMECAEVFYNFLEEEFGPYEELAILLKKKSDVMKDRRFNKEELYPLAMPLEEPKTIPKSPSGEES